MMAKSNWAITDEQYGKLCGRDDEFRLRVRKGVIPFDAAMDHLQAAFYSNLSTSREKRNSAPKSFLTKPFDIVKFFGENWSIWKGPAGGAGVFGEDDVDQRSLAIVEVDVLTIIFFETCLKDDKHKTSGEEKLLKLKATKEFIRFGADVFMGLWLDYQTNKGKSVLEFLYRTKKISYLDFFGTVFRKPNADRYVLHLYREDIRGWDWGCFWLGLGLDVGSLSAGRASQ
jgi:hypothetical protein